MGVLIGSELPRTRYVDKEDSLFQQWCYYIVLGHLVSLDALMIVESIILMWAPERFLWPRSASNIS